VTFYRTDYSVPIMYGITVDSTATVSDVKNFLSKISGVPTGKMVVADVNGSYIYNVVSDMKGLGTLTLSDIRVFEVGGQSSFLIKEATKMKLEKQNENEEFRKKLNKEKEEKEKAKLEKEKKEKEELDKKGKNKEKKHSEEKKI